MAGEHDEADSYNKFMRAVYKLNDREVDAILIGVVFGDASELMHEWKVLKLGDESITSLQWSEAVDSIEEKKSQEIIKRAYLREKVVTN